MLFGKNLPKYIGWIISVLFGFMVSAAIQNKTEFKKRQKQTSKQKLLEVVGTHRWKTRTLSGAGPLPVLWQVKMLSVRLLQRLESVLSQHGNTSLRSFTSHVVQRREDMIVNMENPYKEPQKGCVLCNVQVDYKNIQLLSQFISPHTGRIYGRHITGLCGRKQKEVSKAIKKAHSMGFMSVTHKHPQFMRDPHICGIKPLD